MEELKRIIKDNIKYANCGIYFTNNTVGDPMTPVYLVENIRFTFAIHTIILKYLV